MDKYYVYKDGVEFLLVKSAEDGRAYITEHTGDGSNYHLFVQTSLALEPPTSE